MMNKDTALYQILQILRTQTAAQYVEHEMAREKENPVVCIGNTVTGKLVTEEKRINYFDFMLATWGIKDVDTIADCIERSRMAKFDKYAELIRIYTGWVNNGKQFVLDTRELYISILYMVKPKSIELANGNEPESVKLYTNYNPNNVDCIQCFMPYKRYVKEIQSGDLIVSTKEDELIKKLHELK